MKKKVIWLVNSRLPQIAKSVGETGSNTCGWISGAYDYINEKFDLVVLYPVFQKDKECKVLNGKNKHIAFFQDGLDRTDLAQQQAFAEILKEINPDIIDIWGSEFIRSYNMLKAVEGLSLLDKAVLSFQGSSGEIGEHYYSNLRGAVLHKKTLRDFLRRDSVAKQKKLYDRRGVYENIILGKLSYCIGKTDWDESVALRANHNINYFRCNEILRDAFYKERRQWQADNRHKHTVMLVQGGYPVKGLHIIIEAAAQLKSVFPDLKIKIAGKAPANEKGLKSKLKTSYYSTYLSKLTEKLCLKSAVHFMGDLNENQMIEEYLTSSVLVTASSIENESNSVSEAKYLGVPVVASCVGGVASRINHGEDGFLYPYDEPHMLAYYIEKLFKDDNLCRKISKAEIAASRIINNKDTNNREREKIYNMIISKDSV